ncbi:SDR family oxidoreductase [Vibrio sp. S11_S32]|uniref:SDR family oxidoreductase n=1 Tax=Vibrio sp. S11_S32 TaxID=2720225 RepID=UPI001680AFB9|nr:SDR family oxidoreductase [Vibrio sp. S11_S32]MBD1574899.1 SDR family oxidoreductase [Vibrio sp. S11_S32]
MNIYNSVVVITSAGSHLGQTLAQHFLSLHANVILVDDNEAALNRTLQQCQPTSSALLTYLLDDHSFESVQPLFSSINKHFDQGIDVLINLYPSLPAPSLMDETNFDHYSGQMSSLASTMLCFSKLAAKQMLHNQKKGVIVNLSSQDAENSSDHNSASLISNFTQSWSKELQPFNIRVGGILPPPPHGRTNNWARNRDELIRNTEYIVENDSFNGRVLDCH